MAETPYTVSYNGQEPWISGAPFVSLDVEEVFAAGKVGTIRTVTLNGTYNSGDITFINTLQTAFAENFKVFSAPNVYMPCALVQEVSFNSQNYIGLTEYSIILKDFSGFLFGVTDPIDEVSFTEEQDGSVTIQHRVAAEGIDASTENGGTAFANACSFVRGRTGISNLGLVGTKIVANGNSGNLILVSQQENINRVLGSYSISDTFRYDPLRNTSDGAFKRFSVEFNSGIDSDYIQVAVEGNYAVGKDVWNTGIYQKVAAADLLALAQAADSNINPLPLSFSISAEGFTQFNTGPTGTRTLVARGVYDNSPTASFFEWSAEASKNFKTEITDIAVRGTIIGSGRHVRRKFDSALAFYNSEIGGYDGVKDFLYNAALSGADDFGYTAFPINPNPKGFSVVMNSGLGTISLSASYDDAPFVTGYFEFAWGVNVDCGLNVFKPYPSANVNGACVVQDLNILNRSMVNLEGSFTYQWTGVFDVSEASDMLPLLKNQEGTLNAFSETESYNMSSGDVIRTGFNISYSKEGKNLAILPTNGKIYAGIDL